MLQFASHLFFCHCLFFFLFNNWSRGVWKWNWKENCKFCFEKPFGKSTCFIPLCQHGSWQSCSFPLSKLHCSAFWSRLVTQLPAFIMSIFLDGSHKVCDNMNSGRVWQPDQVTPRGSHFKTKKNKLWHWKCWAMLVYWLQQYCTVWSFVQKPKLAWLVKQCSFFRAVLYLGLLHFTTGKIK